MTAAQRRAEAPTSLFRTEDASGLAVFRIAFGAIMAVDTVRYLAFGWYRTYYSDAAFNFKYLGFAWVSTLPAAGMAALFVTELVAAVAITVGYRYRIAAAVLTLCRTYVFLLEATRYLNHAYLLCLISALMIALPADRALSVDAIRRPERALRAVPVWPRLLLRTQLAVVYFYGGIAKLNADWLAGRPVRKWMAASAEEAWFGGAIIASPWFSDLVMVGGIAFDLLIVPALLWRRTRPGAVAASVAFHLMNAHLFSIGIFPWMMLAATTLFLEPSWPRRLPWVGPRISAAVDRGIAPRSPSPLRAQWIAAGVAAWTAVQVLLPLRHHLYPGDVAWTEEGHYFAWRMKLRSKVGEVRYRITDPATGETWIVDPAEELSRRQVFKMAGHPDLIVQYAHHLRDRYRAERGRDVEVRADAWASLNYHPRKRLVDPNTNLALVKRSLGPASWITQRENERASRP